MTKILIKNGLLVNRGQSKYQDILIIGDRIARIDDQIDEYVTQEIDAAGKWVIPGIIDDQVHFREPGLTHKANIASESLAGVKGGVTSFMEMPNTKPPATSQALLQDKYDIAAQSAAANYSFFMGVTNDNLEEVLKTDPKNVCGLKAFMGSSTGNMLVDNPSSLEALFSNAHMILATHCEDEQTIRNNQKLYDELERELVPQDHPEIRSREGCMKSSSMAVDLAKKYGTRLHVLHISTLNEIALFDAGPISSKHITAEACVHHLFFNDQYYEELGNLIKCNPAIKTEDDRKAIFQAVLDDRIDVIATDHAPHTWEEKSIPFRNAPSGLPLLEHTLVLMLHHYHNGAITAEKIVEKMCHAPAELFDVLDRGYLDEGKFADLVIVDPYARKTIQNEDVSYHCGWSPLAGMTFKGEVETTIINGTIKYHLGVITSDQIGRRLSFNR
jgi:dihydroorotase